MGEKFYAMKVLYVLIIVLCYSMHGLSQHKSAFVSKLPAMDTCAAVVNLYGSEIDKSHLSAYIRTHGNCALIYYYLSGNNFDRQSKATVMMAVSKVEKDPTFILERFLELDIAIKFYPSILLKNFANDLKGEQKLDDNAVENKMRLNKSLFEE